MNVNFFIPSYIPLIIGCKTSISFYIPDKYYENGKEKTFLIDYEASLKNFSIVYSKSKNKFYIRGIPCYHGEDYIKIMLNSEETSLYANIPCKYFKELTGYKFTHYIGINSHLIDIYKNNKQIFEKTKNENYQTTILVQEYPVALGQNIYIQLYCGVPIKKIWDLPTTLNWEFDNKNGILTIYGNITLYKNNVITIETLPINADNYTLILKQIEYEYFN